MEVRAGFGAKVRRTVLLLNGTPGGVQRAAKYAAMLPLAGMDPNEANRSASGTALGRRSAPAGALIVVLPSHC